MKCEDAAEFVSALFDGERIPREAAEHIGVCDACKARLQDYATAAVELRRVAILKWAGDLTPVEWHKEPRERTAWWRKGAEAMRIPKFAFVLMLVVILGLASSLPIVKARAKAVGPVVLVTMNLPGGREPLRCALSTNGDSRGAECAFFQGANRGFVAVSIRFVQRDAEAIRLGIRNRFFGTWTANVSTEVLKTLPEKEYELKPGEKLKVDIDGVGEAEMTGALLDHMPVFASGQETLDPAEDEVRVVSPVLMRDKEVVLDMEGGSALGKAKDGAVSIYSPGIGRFIVSAVPFKGAVRGDVKLNRVHFDVDSQTYQLLAGAPITRAQELWVQLDPNYKPDSNDAHGSIGWAKLSYLLDKQ